MFGVFREHVTNKRQCGETDGLDPNSLMCLVGCGTMETMNHLFIECVFFYRSYLERYFKLNNNCLCFN